MIFLFGMELQNFLAISTSSAIVIDKSSIDDSLRVDFNISFPVLSCEFASVDVSDVVGTYRLNITKTVRKYSISEHLQTNGFEFDYEPVTHTVKHDDKVDEGYGEGSVRLNERNFDRITHMHPIVVVNFYAPWCHWSNRL
ncbi:Thioredoxin-like fold, partial [Cynara cardunculus var. scolymus]